RLERLIRTRFLERTSPVLGGDASLKGSGGRSAGEEPRSGAAVLPAPLAPVDFCHPFHEEFLRGATANLLAELPPTLAWAGFFKSKQALYTFSYPGAGKENPGCNMSILLKTSFCFLALLAPLCAQRQRMPAPAEKNPFDTPQDVEQGAGLFQTHCSYCHGSHGEGGRGADLTAGQYRYGGSDAELYATIRNGIPGSEMPPVRATDDEIWRIVAFVKKIGSSGLMEKAPGDPAAGKLVYDKSGCSACHSINK